MDLTNITRKLNLLAEPSGLICKDVIQVMFEIKKNSANGNCLFESIEQQNNIYNHVQLRNRVCDYYKSFNPNATYRSDSYEEKIALLFNSEDNVEYSIATGKPLKTKHSKAICKKQSYASIMDIFVIALLLQVNIIIMIYNSHNKKYQINVLSNKPASENTLFVKFDGEEHYEAMIPRIEFTHSNIQSKSKSKSKSNSNSKSTSKSTSKSKSTSTSTSKSKSTSNKITKRCQNGYRRNRNTGNCDKKTL